MNRYDGLRVVITGAAGAFGSGVRHQLEIRGARVVGLDIAGGEGIIRCDVRDEQSVRAAVDQAAKRLGGIDVLINNAGLGDSNDAGAMPGERELETIDVNCLGPWRVTAAALPELLRSRGRVIVVASGLSFVNVPLVSAYAVSKRGVTAWADSLRMEYGRRLSGVTVVLPGYVRTPIHDRAAKRGAALEGLVPAEPIAATVRTIVAACVGRPRRYRATTRQLGVAVRSARKRPRLVDAVINYSVRRYAKRGRFDLALDGQHLRADPTAPAVVTAAAAAATSAASDTSQRT